MTTDAGPKRACLEVALPAGTVRLAAPGEGRRHDLAALRDDVLLRADRRRLDAETARPAHRRVREALVRPHLGGRPALHERHGLRDRERRVGRARSSRRRRTSSPSARRSTRCMRQLALEIVADGEGARRVGRIVVRGDADDVEPRGALGGDSPLVKTALHGGDPNFGRILQAAGQALAAGAPFLVDLDDRGTSARERRATRRHRPETSCAELEQAVRGDEVEYRAHAARRGRRDRGLLLRPVARVRDHQRGLHDMRDVETLLEALPYIREFHGQTVVIKYGGAAMTDAGAEGRLRARRRAAQLRRDEPDRGARRRARHHALHGAARHGGEFLEGLRVSDEATVEVAKMVLVGKQNKDIVLSAQPPRPVGGGDLRRRRRPLPRAQELAGGRGHRLRRRDRARGRRRPEPHRARTTSP